MGADTLPARHTLQKKKKETSKRKQRETIIKVTTGPDQFCDDFSMVETQRGVEAKKGDQLRTK